MICANFFHTDIGDKIVSVTPGAVAAAAIGGLTLSVCLVWVTAMVVRRRQAGPREDEQGLHQSDTRDYGTDSSTLDTVVPVTLQTPV